MFDSPQIAKEGHASGASHAPKFSFLDVLLSMACNNIPKNGRSSSRYLFHNRRGSLQSRHNHSKPLRCIHAGARGINSPTKLNDTPTPMANDTPESFAWSYIHCSCQGAPNPTNRISAPLSRILD